MLRQHTLEIVRSPCECSWGLFAPHRTSPLFQRSVRAVALPERESFYPELFFPCGRSSMSLSSFEPRLLRYPSRCERRASYACSVAAAASYCIVVAALFLVRNHQARC